MAARSASPSRSSGSAAATPSRCWALPIGLRSCVPIGLGLGRIANFINGELWGRPAPDWLPWAMIFPQWPGPSPRHPSQLYQALLEGLVLFLVMFALSRREAPARAVRLADRRVPGRLCASRASPASSSASPTCSWGILIGGVTMGQLLCIPMLIGGALADPAHAVMERLDHFMARANAAYYATHDPFADFTTSPEISQVFGEILGLWAAVTWELIGRPDPVLLVEAGPGRGTLMADALRAIARVAPAFRAALRLHLIETSPRLRAMQAERLPGAIWHDGLDTLPDAPLLLLANEFLDALPIRQFVRRGELWMERFVEDGRFVECAARPSPRPLPQWEVGVTPTSPSPCGRGGGGGSGPSSTNCNEPALAIARSSGTRLSARPGAALFLDYGPEHSAPGDSLQALRDGRPADPLCRSRHRRPHRPCRLRRLRRRRPRRRRGNPWPIAPGHVPHPARPVPAHRPAGTHPAARTGIRA